MIRRSSKKPPWLWFQSRCARVSEITWGSLSLLVGPAALLQQVSNDYKIRFGQFIFTTWTCTLVNPLPFILKLSALIYLIGVTGEEALTRRPAPPPSFAMRPCPSQRPFPCTSSVPYVQAHYFYAPLHSELWLTSSGDEQRLIIGDRSDVADCLTAERMKGATDQVFRLKDNGAQQKSGSQGWRLVSRKPQYVRVKQIMHKSL